MDLTNRFLITATMLASLLVATPVSAHAQRGEHCPMGRAAVAKARVARAVAHRPELALAVDLRRLEALYRRNGQPDAVVAMYQDLLKRSDDEQLRRFAQRRLDQAQRLADPQREIAELRGRVDAALAKPR